MGSTITTHFRSGNPQLVLTVSNANSAKRLFDSFPVTSTNARAAMKSSRPFVGHATRIKRLSVMLHKPDKLKPQPKHLLQLPTILLFHCTLVYDFWSKVSSVTVNTYRSITITRTGTIYVQ
ncbi:hypothetical protein SAMN02745220_01619 [Desulfopila aestuarii DSM 18488]|uniref:Uncharacterized protein n=1 Tax=Desulfopila aestuarii DSM 18488 TaxID=1121416 RepID=A0A1M7Y3I1_9BACT|nr:hypothetical protein SAMN02745220_01619 [Desulfopila aestuarii DSM 18488]